MMPSPQDRHHLLDEVRQWCQQHLQVSSLQEAEELAVAISREVGQAIVEQGAKQIDGKATYDGCSMACGCGRKAKFKGYRPRFVVTLAGGVRVERAYYHCRHCRTGAMPWDAREGLTGLQWTPGVKSLVGQLVGRLAYAESVELLGLTTGLRMAYPQFRARGLMIGSGLAEAACKVVVGHRLERAGMRWCRRGADAVLAIRCAVLNREYHRLDSAARAA